MMFLQEVPITISADQLGAALGAAALCVVLVCVSLAALKLIERHGKRRES